MAGGDGVPLQPNPQNSTNHDEGRVRGGGEGTRKNRGGDGGKEEGEGNRSKEKEVTSDFASS